MRLAVRTPTHTPMGANGRSAKKLAKFRMSSKPSHAQGSRLVKLIKKKKYATVAVKTKGLSLSGMASALGGNSRRCAKKQQSKCAHNTCHQVGLQQLKQRE